MPGPGHSALLRRRRMCHAVPAAGRTAGRPARSARHRRPRRRRPQSVVCRRHPVPGRADQPAAALGRARPRHEDMLFHQRLAAVVEALHPAGLPCPCGPRRSCRTSPAAWHRCGWPRTSTACAGRHAADRSSGTRRSRATGCALRARRLRRSATISTGPVCTGEFIGRRCSASTRLPISRVEVVDPHQVDPDRVAVLPGVADVEEGGGRRLEPVRHLERVLVDQQDRAGTFRPPLQLVEEAVVAARRFAIEHQRHQHEHQVAAGDREVVDHVGIGRVDQPGRRAGCRRDPADRGPACRCPPCSRSSRPCRRCPPSDGRKMPRRRSPRTRPCGPASAASRGRSATASRLPTGPAVRRRAAAR